MGTKQYDSATDLLTFSRASGGTALRKISYSNDELVTNGTFDTNASGWVGNNSHYSPTIESQRLKVITGASGQWNYAQTSVSGLTIGKMYRFQASSFAGTTDSHRISLGTVSGQSYDIFGQGVGYNVNQTVDRTFTATTTVVYVSLQNTDGVDGSTTFFDNISIKEVLFDQADGTLQLFNHGNNMPRIEYDATGAVKGLLIEEARTNGILTSEVAPTNYFGGLTKSVDNSVVSPAGGNNVEKFTLSNANDYHYVGNHHNISTGTGNSTYSIFAKGSGHNLIRLRMSNVSGIPSCDFDLSTGQKQVTSSSDSSVTGSIESIGNGWWRCAITYDAVKLNPYASVFLIDAMDASSLQFQGDGTSGVYVWGSQYETGAFPTSYIPTTGAAATRARDIAEIPTSAFGYNNDAGTVVCEFDSAALYGSTIFTLVVGQATHGMTAIIYPYHRVSYQVVTGGGIQVNSNFDAYPTASQVSKVATVYAKDDFAAVLNGGAVATDTAGSVPPVSTLKLGVYWGAGDFFMSGHIKSIQYYPRRLTNTQLQELTT